MKKGFIIAGLLLFLFTGVGLAQTNQDNAIENIRLNVRVSELEQKLEAAEARIELQLNGLEQGLANNRGEIEDRIGSLDQDGDGQVDLPEAADAVGRAAETNPELLQEPEFWASLVLLVVSGIVGLLRKKIAAAMHVFGRKEAAKRGFPSGHNGNAEVPVGPQGEPLVSENTEDGMGSG